VDNKTTAAIDIGSIAHDANRGRGQADVLTRFFRASVRSEPVQEQYPR
jgi:hypothetical protein